MKNETHYMVFGSLQNHSAKTLVENGVCPTIGCTDFGLPRLVLLTHDKNEVHKRQPT